MNRNLEGGFDAAVFYTRYWNGIVGVVENFI